MNLNEVYEAVVHHNKNECVLRDRFLLGGHRVYATIDQLCSKELGFLKDRDYIDISTQSPHEIVKWLRNKSRTKKMQDQISKCAHKILPIVSLETALHEFGHNLSMRHNFRGSSDQKNSLSPKSYKYNYIFSDLKQKEKDQIMEWKLNGSTVMDYNSVAGFHLNPGGYDVAFLRLFYGGELETKSGNMISMDLSSPNGMSCFRRCFYKKIQVLQDLRYL